MPNVENFNKLIRALEDEELLVEGVKFDMRTWYNRTLQVEIELGDSGIQHECNTIACLAGHARILIEREGRLTEFYCEKLSTTKDIAAKWLGIDYETATRLFQPSRLRSINRSQAIATLKRFVETGEVVW